LKKAAREQRRTSWPALKKALGNALPRLDENERIEILCWVDRTTAADAPLLSALIQEADGTDALHIYRTVTQRLGRPVPEDDAALRATVENDVARLHARALDPLRS
jgi:hypothetical protein